MNRIHQAFGPKPIFGKERASLRRWFAAILSSLCLLSLTTVAAGAEPATPTLKRGINLSRVFGFPVRDRAGSSDYAWPPFSGPLSSMDDSELKRLAELGFDFVRLPVDPGPFLTAVQSRRDTLQADLQAFIKRLLALGLKVVVDIHPSTYASRWKPADILADTQSGPFRAYGEFLGDIAHRLGAFPRGQVALELMNEPQPDCPHRGGEDWTEIQKTLFRKIRAAEPALPLVVTGGCWSSVDGLLTLRAADFDEATLFDVHFYDPHAFTHQSAAWARAPLPHLAGLAYPAESGSAAKTLAAAAQFREAHASPPKPLPTADAAGLEAFVDRYYRVERPGPALIERRLALAKSWAEANGVAPGRILLGEFGAIRWPAPLDDGSRGRWLADVRSAAERLGFPWALWDYDRVFGLVLDYGDRSLDPQVMAALGLNGKTSISMGNPPWKP